MKKEEQFGHLRFLMCGIGFGCLLNGRPKQLHNFGRKRCWNKMEEDFMGTFWKKTEVVEPAFSNRRF